MTYELWHSWELYRNQDSGHTHPSEFLCPAEVPPHSSLPPVLLSQAPTHLISTAVDSLHFQGWCEWSYTEHTLFGLTSCSIIILRLIYAFACVNSSFLFAAEEYSMLWVCHSLFIYLPTEGHYGCFHFLAIKKLNLYMFNLHIDIGSLNKYWGGMAEYMVGVCVIF